MTPARRRVAALAAAALLALCAAPGASAQNDLNYNIPDFTTPGVSASLLDLNRPASTDRKGGTRTRPAAPPKATARQLRTLRFATTAARTRAIDAELARSLRGITPPEAHAGLDEAIAKGSHRRALDEIVRHLGGSPRDLGDRIGAGLVVAWLAYERDRRPAPAGQTTNFEITATQRRGGRAFLRQVRHALAREARVRRLSDARKQRIADAFGITVVHADAMIRGLSDADRRQEAAQIQDALAGAVRRSLGIDLRRITLTGTGFKG